MNDKFLNMLGLARRAGQVCIGYDKTLALVHAKKVFAVFCACDLSPKTKKGLCIAAENTDIQIISTASSIFEMSNAIGIKAGIVGITNDGFAKRLIELSQQ